MSTADHFFMKLHWTEKCNEDKFYHRPMEIFKIRDVLHRVFSILPLMEILRDYILGGAMVPLDIFQGIPISSEHIYRFLCFISYGCSDPVRKAKKRVSLEITNEKGDLLTLSMLGSLASSSIISRYKHFNISCPLTALATLDSKDAEEILVERYRCERSYARELFKKGMKVRYSQSILDVKEESFGDLLIASIIFMDPEQIEQQFYQIATLVQSHKTAYCARIDEEDLTSAGSEMGEIFHRSGLLALNASSIVEEITSFGDRDHNHSDPHYVKKNLWIPMRFMFRNHAKVVEEGEFSSTVEYMRDGKAKRYKVGMADGKTMGIGDAQQRQKTYKEPLYEFPNGETLPYYVMLFMCATRFVSNVCDEESRNHVLKIVGKMHDRLLLISGFESGKGDMKGYGDKIRDFIIYNKDLDPSLSPVPSVP